MSSTIRRTGLGVIVVLVAVLASLLTRVTAGSAAAGTTTKEITHVNVVVYLKSGTKHYTDVSSVRLFDGGKELKVTPRGGSTHTFKTFRSYRTSFAQTTVTSPTSPTPTPTPTGPTGSPTPTVSPTVTVSPTDTPSLPLPTITVTNTPPV
jgi:hypothetical protein